MTIQDDQWRMAQAKTHSNFKIDGFEHVSLDSQQLSEMEIKSADPKKYTLYRVWLALPTKLCDFTTVWMR